MGTHLQSPSLVKRDESKVELRDAARLLRAVLETTGGAAATLVRTGEDGEISIINSIGSTEIVQRLKDIFAADIVPEIKQRRRESDSQVRVFRPSNTDFKLQYIPLHSGLGLSHDLLVAISAETPEAELVRVGLFVQTFLSALLQETERRHDIEAVNSGLLHAANTLQDGVFIVDRDRRILFANSAGHKRLDEATVFVETDQRLGTVSLQHSVRLAEVIGFVSSHEYSLDGEHRSCALLVLPETADAITFCAVCPVSATLTLQGDPAAIIVLFDSSTPAGPLLDPLCELYTLSAVEKQLLTLLIEGHSLNKIAERMKVKRETARGYLKNVFVKTDTHSQSQLIQRILTQTPRLHDALRVTLVN